MSREEDRYAGSRCCLTVRSREFSEHTPFFAQTFIFSIFGASGKLQEKRTLLAPYLTWRVPLSPPKEQQMVLSVSKKVACENLCKKAAANIFANLQKGA